MELASSPIGFLVVIILGITTIVGVQWAMRRMSTTGILQWLVPLFLGGLFLNIVGALSPEFLELLLAPLASYLPSIRAMSPRMVVNYLVIFGGFFVIVRYLTSTALRYLDTPSPSLKFNTLSDSTRFARDVRERLDGLAEQIRGLPVTSSPPIQPFTAAEREAIVERLKERLTEDITPSLLGTIEAKYSSDVQEYKRLVEVRAQCDRTKSRLLEEIAALSRRGNLNLVIGALTTGIAVVLLGYVVLNADLRGGDWRALLPNYILRLSLVVFIEIFSFFFLRLYRTSLTEIKYFQNELTNIEAKFIALESALLLGDPVAVKMSLKELSGTERNFMLKKGETTSELERMKLEGEGIKDILKQLTSLLGGLKK